MVDKLRVTVYMDPAIVDFIGTLPGTFEDTLDRIVRKEMESEKELLNRLANYQRTNRLRF